MRFLFTAIFILKTLCLFSQSDTIRDTTYKDGVRRIFDGNKTLRQVDVYLGEEKWHEHEETFSADGITTHKIRWYKNGIPWIVEDVNFNTGRLEHVERDTSGRMVFYYEMATDSFDAETIWYYPNGKMEAKGFSRFVDIYVVSGFNAVSIGEMISKTSQGKVYDDVGLWHYYYPDGKDSAVGNYAYVVYECDSTFPSQPGELYIIIGITRMEDIKDGVWNYFSSEGKLICTEEWNKGNLLKRTNF